MSKIFNPKSYTKTYTETTSLTELKQDRMFHTISFGLFAGAQLVGVGIHIYEMMTDGRQLTLLNSIAYIIITFIILCWIRVIRKLNMKIKNYHHDVELDNTVEIITPVNRECHTDGKVDDVHDVRSVHGGE